MTEIKRNEEEKKAEKIRLEQTFKTDAEREDYSDLLWTMHKKYENLEKKVNAIMEAKWSTRNELQKVSEGKRGLKM